MALTRTDLHLAILVTLTRFILSHSVTNVSNAMPPVVKTILDPKRRSDLVDEAFLEQKDVLLDMLEAKLKEVRDKKKKKTDRGENVNNNYSNTHIDTIKCEQLPKNVDLNLNAHGISAIGEADVKLKFGDNGNGTLNLDATGISNIGQTHVDLGVGDGTIHIPGLNNIFIGPSFLKKACQKADQTEAVSPINNSSPILMELKESDSRKMRNGNITINSISNDSSNSNVGVVTLNPNNTEKVIENNKVNNPTVTPAAVNIISNMNPSVAAVSPTT